MRRRRRRALGAAPPEPGLPPAIALETRRGVRDLWADRMGQVLHDTYAGAPLMKLPEDLRLYEHLLWLSAPDAVIELGAKGGGGALWFRDRLAALAAYGRGGTGRVVSVDLDVALARERLDAADPAWPERITLIEGDVRDPGLPDRVAAALGGGARCLVSEDTAHVHATTLAALRGFSRFVAPGGFFVVEDGCVDHDALRVDPAWPRGVLPAVRQWLASPEGAGWQARRDLELYGLTCHPEGILQRSSTAR